MEAEIEIFRRMMEEAALAIAPREGMTVDARRDYILNCLMTKVRFCEAIFVNSPMRDTEGLILTYLVSWA